MVDLVYLNLVVYGNDCDEVFKLVIVGIKILKYKLYFFY